MPRSETPLRSDLFPEISPYASGMLAVDGRHTIYWEQSGNPDGVPVLFLHGGPGAGSAPVHRRFFDPQFYRIVVFDQRGCGRSMPLGEVHDNTTGASRGRHGETAEPISASPQWLLFGGSWGSTLALAYGLQLSRSASTGFILRGIFLGARLGDRLVPPWHARHLPRGVARLRRTPAGERARRSSGQLLSPPDRPQSRQSTARRRAPGAATRRPARRSIRRRARPSESDHGGFALGLSRIEAHYFAHGTFVPEGWPWADLDRIRNLACTIVQGRYDIVCPPVTADALARAWPEARYVVVPGCRPQRAGTRASARRWSTPPRASGCRAATSTSSPRDSLGNRRRQH